MTLRPVLAGEAPPVTLTEKVSGPPLEQTAGGVTVGAKIEGPMERMGVPVKVTRSKRQLPELLLY